MHIPEDILHFIWRFRLFQPYTLYSLSGDRIEVLHPGQYNRDAGPDFLFSRLRIGGREWHGHVEIHVLSSGWKLHGHHQDVAYNAVILHVVWAGNTPCYLADGTLLPCLQLRDFIPADFLERAERLLGNLHWLPCHYALEEVPNFQKLQVLQRMGVARLEERYTGVMDLLAKFKGDWERVSFCLLSAAFGMKVNKDAFIDYSDILSLRLLKKLKGRALAIQALFFGQAGFLTGQRAADEYMKTLQVEFRYLKHAHQLQELSPHQWKFLRMRPFNFPTFKLAQLAAMYTACPSWFSNIVHAQNLTELHNLCQEIKVPDYWERHFHFEQETRQHSTAISLPFFHLLAINAFVQLLFAYGKHIDNAEMMDRAISWLENLKKEDNSIVRRYQEYGLEASNALESQALLHLRNRYCNTRRCLSCGIALEVIRGDLCGKV